MERVIVIWPVISHHQTRLCVLIQEGLADTQHLTYISALIHHSQGRATSEVAQHVHMVNNLYVEFNANMPLQPPSHPSLVRCL